MGQLFKERADTYLRLAILSAVAAVVAGIAYLYTLNSSSYNLATELPLPQPVPFSHEHHVAGLGLDCRYCHYTVERASFAGIPAAQICMNCHAQIWTNAAMLEPIRDAAKNNTPILWRRIYDLPDFVYFNHSVHLAKGIGCENCHGRVDRMPLMRKVTPLQMEWCLECHRHPVANLRPRSELTSMGWQFPGNEREIAQLQEGLAREYAVRSQTDCAVCHR